MGTKKKKFSLHPTAQIGKSVSFNDSNRPTMTDNQSAWLGINSSELLPRKSTEDRALPEENPSFKGTAPSSVFPSARVADVRIATSPEDDVRNVISGMDGCLSSRVVDARSMNAPKLTS